MRCIWLVGMWGMVWPQVQWDQQSIGRQIAVKELLPVIIAAAIWGHEWAGKWVVSNCDNQAVVAVLNSRYSREKDLMQLLRCLFFLEAHFQFQLSAYHLPGILNDCADDLSRNHLSSFQAKMPMADTYSSSIPPSLLQWLLHPDLSWTSPIWIQLFNSFVRKE